MREMSGIRLFALLVCATIIMTSQGLTLLVGATPTSASAAQIKLSLEPTTIYYPGVLPTDGVAFSQNFFVNYSKTLSGKSMLLQVDSVRGWINVTSFLGNSLGYTVLQVPVTNRWASFGNNTIRVVSVNASSNVVQLRIVEDGSGYVDDLAVYAAVICLVLIFFVASRLLKPGAFLTIAVIVYAGLAAFGGHRYDMFYLISSGIRVLDHVNPLYPGNPPAYPFSLKWSYPPLYPYYSALSNLVFEWVTRSVTPSSGSINYPGYLTSEYSIWRGYIPNQLPLLSFILKIPMIASVFIVYYLLKAEVGHKIAASLWLANPLTLLVGGVWGQLDPISVALAVFALYSFQNAKFRASYILSAFGAAVKIWPGLLIPVFFVLRLKDTGKKAAREIVWVLPALLTVVVGYMLLGNPVQSVLSLVLARSIPTYAGHLSVNGLTWEQYLTLVSFPPVPISLYIGIPAYATLLAAAYLPRSRSPLPWVVLSILILFLTYNYVNPQYFLWVVPIFLLMRWTRISIVYSIIPLVYVALSYNIAYFISPSILYDYYSPAFSIAEELKLAYFFHHPLFYFVLIAAIPTAVYLFTAVKVTRASLSKEPEKKTVSITS